MELPRGSRALWCEVPFHLTGVVLVRMYDAVHISDARLYLILSDAPKIAHPPTPRVIEELVDLGFLCTPGQAAREVFPGCM